MPLHRVASSRLHNAIRAVFRSSSDTTVNQPPVVRVPPAMGRARVPLACMPRVSEVDGPTTVLPRPGSPAMNGGRGYTSRVFDVPRQRNSSTVTAPFAPLSAARTGQEN